MWSKPFLIALCLAVVASLSVGAQATPVYNPANGHYYDAISVALSWDAANTAAASSSYGKLQGHLATVTSAAENQFIVSQFPQSVSGGYWLGGYQPDGVLDPAAGWQWVTGEPWSYTNWDAGEPNDFFGPGSEQKLQLWPYTSDGLWNDFPNVAPPGILQPGGYVVEYEGPGNSQGNVQGLVSLPPQSPTLESSLASVEATTPTSILFVNRTNQTVQIYWLDYQGNRVYYNTLLPGQSYVQPTYVTHPWVVTDQAGNGLVIFLPDAQAGEALISPATINSVAVGTGVGNSPPGKSKVISLTYQYQFAAPDITGGVDERVHLVMTVTNNSNQWVYKINVDDAPDNFFSDGPFPPPCIDCTFDPAVDLAPGETKTIQIVGPSFLPVLDPSQCPKGPPVAHYTFTVSDSLGSQIVPMVIPSMCY